MGNDFKSVEQVLGYLNTGWDEWDALLESVPKQRLTERGVEGDWSIKDIVAHVTWYEREMVYLLHERTLAGSEWWNLSIDERNRKIFEENRDRSLEGILDEHQRVHSELMAEVEKLSDQDLNDPSRIAKMPPDWQLWQLLSGNTYTHYADHIQSIRQWLE